MTPEDGPGPTPSDAPAAGWADGASGYASDMDVAVERNDEAQRYEARLGGELVGIADYQRVGDVVVLPHTVVDPAMRGRGIAAELVRRALDDIRADGASVDPQCSYVAEFIARQPGYADMVARA